ncbi:glycosyltransferase family 4 protein [Enterobacteriaceae bacterium YMB-R22]|jgi:glycosyltransferase involved in cell wall biosynthesis|uniref:glycosyltransferase family 4 protein n=1 Tax=Tenebrionicola larvae TaxID=2815733 RepID=UPI002010ECA2|nr:glycosyltransferase family 4 protein [Tenebrionicola larvae]MBV4411291.1 glycosyltransferase family 4 protein [Tenebrionicola larvae]
MKVAYICADPGIPVFGQKGASIHIQEVLRVLLRHGVEITLFAQRLGGEPPAAFRSLTIIELPALVGGVDEVARADAALDANAALLTRFIEAGPFDVVYERYSLWSHAVIGYARQSGIPTVLEVNAPLPQEQRRYRRLVRAREAFGVIESLVSDADTIIAVSRGVKGWLETFSGAQGKVRVVENGVDPARFSQRSPAADGPLTLGFVGTLKPWHGLETLVEAFILLREKGYPVTLSIVGDGPQAAVLRARLSQCGAAGSARFHGAVAPEQVPALLASMDIGIAPYPQLDNFYFSPLKIYEYMAAGLPVITSRVGHLAELVSDGETGLLVAPQDPVALAQAVMTLADDPLLRQRLGLAGQARAQQHHSWEQVVKRIWLAAGLRLPEGAKHGG